MSRCLYMYVWGKRALAVHTKGGAGARNRAYFFVHSIHPPGETGERIHSPGDWARFVGELVDRGIVASCLGKERGLRADDYR